MGGIVINFWNTLFLAAATQGIFLSIVLVTNKRKNESTYFLSLLILLFSINLFFYVLFWSGITVQLQPFFDLVLLMVLLLGPLAYLYVKSVRGEKFSTKDLKHFYAFPVVTVLYFMEAFDIRYYFIKTIPTLECGSLLFYSVLIFRINKHHKVNDTKLEKFLSQYAILFFVFAASFVSYYVLYYTKILKIEYDYAISLSMSVIIYFIGYRGYFLPEVRDGSNPALEKYEKSGLTSQAEEYYANKITDLMTEKKLYTNSDLRLKDLSNELKISPHHASQVINSYFGQTFSDYINKMRVEAAMKMMQSSKYKNETLIGIAYLCGFNNKVSFNKSFHKFVGESPGTYRKQNSDVKYHQAEA